jgi:hypothetical protein
MHNQIPVLVTVDVDEGIADLVIYLNTIQDVRTHASCQGTLLEGGPEPYRPQVMVSWNNDDVFRQLENEFDLSDIGKNWAYLHPRPSDKRWVICQRGLA